VHRSLTGSRATRAPRRARPAGVRSTRAPRRAT